MQLFNLEDDIGVVTGALGKLGPIWDLGGDAAGGRRTGPGVGPARHTGGPGVSGPAGPLRV